MATVFGLSLTCCNINATLVLSEELKEALAFAYQNNPDLLAARANLRKIDEGVPAARAGWRPTVTSNLSIGVS